MPSQSEDEINAKNVAASGGNFSLNEPKSDRTSKSTTKKIVKRVRTKKPDSFYDFIREQAVVGLVIGFVLGTQVQSLVKQFIDSFVDPFTQLLLGSSLSDKAFTVHIRNRSAQFTWGASLNAFIIFLVVVFVLYLFVKVLKLEKLDKKKEAAKS